jgi:thymidylate kinase
MSGERIGGVVAARRKRRVRVSFSGLDGAGKSAQIAALVSALEIDHSIDVRWVPFKIWPEPVLNRLSADMRSRLGPKRSALTSENGDPSGSADSPAPARSARHSSGGATARARRFVWTGVGAMAAVSAGLSLRHRASGRTADIVVLDRYRLDSIVKLQFWYGEVSPALLTRIVAALTPDPDVEFLFQVDPEEAYRRKPEQWSVNQLRRQAEMYERLASMIPELVLLDAHRSPAELSTIVEKHVRAVVDAR